MKIRGKNMGLFSKKQTAPAADDRWEALHAEYQNYRRRTAQELELAEARAARKTVCEFLCIYDDLQRALASPCSDPAFHKGVELIFKQLLDTLAALGVKPMDSKGKMFNPTYHEAVEQVRDSKYRPDEIVEVLRVGFTMDDEVIRHAKVVVANCE